MSKYEYLEDNPDTWKFHEPPTFPTWFQEELIKIAGKNRHNQPNLRVVWGGTCPSDRAEERGHLKYHCGFSPTQVLGYRYQKEGEWHFTENIDNLDSSIIVYPETRNEPLGLMRWIVEKWTSPEELEFANRFQTRFAEGETTATLREFPREGIYDCWLIIANSQDKYRDVDVDVVDFIKGKWHYEQTTSIEEHEKHLAEMKALEHQKGLEWNRELSRAAKNFDLKLDKEERERREEYWAKHHDYSQDKF